MNVDVRAGEERCIGQELDQEDIAFFTMSASAKPTNEEDKAASVKAITASVRYMFPKVYLLPLNLLLPILIRK